MYFSVISENNKIVNPNLENNKKLEGIVGIPL